jgi:hypothetical protein
VQNWERDRAVSFLGIFVSNFQCSVDLIKVNYLYLFVFVYIAKNRLGDGYSMYRVSGQVIYGIYYDNMLPGIGGINKV